MRHLLNFTEDCKQSLHVKAEMFILTDQLKTKTEWNKVQTESFQTHIGFKCLELYRTEKKTVWTGKSFILYW